MKDIKGLSYYCFKGLQQFKHFTAGFSHHQSAQSGSKFRATFP
jgi:hypothetical protein